LVIQVGLNRARYTRRQPEPLIRPITNLAKVPFTCHHETVIDTSRHVGAKAFAESKELARAAHVPFPDY